MGPGLEHSPETAGSDKTRSTDVSPGTVDTDQGPTEHFYNKNLVHTKNKHAASQSIVELLLGAQQELGLVSQ